MPGDHVSPQDQAPTRAQQRRADRRGVDGRAGERGRRGPGVHDRPVDGLRRSQVIDRQEPSHHRRERTRVMSKRLFGFVALATVVCAPPALAQEHRAEVGVLVGWAWSEGVNGDPVATADGNIYDRVDPKSAFKWGLSAAVLASEEAEIGFRFGQQPTKLRAKGTNTADIGDMTVDNYH